MKKLSKKKVSQIAIIALFLIVGAFSFASPLSYARYRTTEENGDSFGVAKPISELVVTRVSDNTFIAPDTSSYEYDLIVNNFVNEEINEVNMLYRVKAVNVSSVTKLPLVLTLFDNNTETPREISFTSWQTGYDFELATSEKVSTYFRLSMSWDKSNPNYDDYKYNDLENIIRISIDLKQVEGNHE